MWKTNGGQETWPGRSTYSQRDMWLDWSMIHLDVSGVAHLGGNQKAALSGWALQAAGRLPPFAQKRKVLYGTQCSSK